MTVDFPLPPNLPEPVDDGAADHLRSIEMPDLRIQSTAGRLVDLSRLVALPLKEPSAVTRDATPGP